jgi:hypothetical protein
MINADAFSKLLATILALVFVGFLLSYPAMLLWNGCLVPAIPAIQPVSWLQMWGISILFSIMIPRASVSNKN